jgi:hypothetical protein
MNSDQNIIAFMSVALICLVLWGAYRSTLKDILFNAPPASGSSGSSGSIIPDLPHLINPYLP